MSRRKQLYKGAKEKRECAARLLLAVKQNTRKYYWTGRITVKGGTVYDFGQDDIVKGSGYITSQCCGSTEIELGT